MKMKGGGTNPNKWKRGAGSKCEARNGAISRGGEAPNWSSYNNEHKGVQGKKNDPLSRK